MKEPHVGSLMPGFLGTTDSLQLMLSRTMHGLPIRGTLKGIGHTAAWQLSNRSDAEQMALW